MNDLDPIRDPDLAFLIEPAALRDDGARRARARGTTLRRRRVSGAVAGGLCVVLVLAGLAFAARGSRGTQSTADHRRTSVPHVDPPLPRGWRHVDWGAVRFAVPDNFSIRTGASCSGADVELLGETEPASSCTKTASDRQVTAQVHTPPTRAVGRGICRGARRLNGLAVIIPCGLAPGTPYEPGSCPASGCTIQLGLGPSLAVTIADPAIRTTVIRSITTSPAYRAVHDGPTLDTRHWKTVTGAGVTMKVPRRWRIERHRPYDLVPWCGIFPSATAIVGGKRVVPSCPSVPYRLEDVNAAWARTPDPQDEAMIGSRPLKRVTINGHRLTTVGTGDPGTASPALTVLVGPPRRASIVDLSIGGDPDVSRTILTTIRPPK